jgi:hypothetical protein
MSSLRRHAVAARRFGAIRERRPPRRAGGYKDRPAVRPAPQVFCYGLTSVSGTTAVASATGGFRALLLPAFGALCLRQGSKPKAETAARGLGSREPGPPSRAAFGHDKSSTTLCFRMGSSRHTAHSSKACRTVVVSTPWSARRSKTSERSVSRRAKERSASKRTS